MGKAYTLIKKNFSAKIVLHDNRKTFVLEAPRWLQHHLNKFNVGDKVTISITNEKLKRTENQNRYYWLYLGMISAETGNDIDDLHTLFKGLFLGKAIVEVLGHKVRQVRSTTELSTGQFVEYIQRIEEKTGILSPPVEEWMRTGESEKLGKLPEYPENNLGETKL